MNLRKYLFTSSIITIIAILFVLFIVAGCSVLLEKQENLKKQSQQNPISSTDTSTSSTSLTAGWQTYRNEQNGFEVKYPPYYGVGTGLTRDRRTYPIFVNNKYYTETNPPSIIGLTLEYDPLFLTAFERQSTFFDRQYEKNSLIQIFFTNGDGRRIYATCALFAPTNEENNEVFNICNQILSTFKFIDIVDTSTWQTYRNEVFGFEFKSPIVFSVGDLLKGSYIKYGILEGTDLVDIFFSITITKQELSVNQVKDLTSQIKQSNIKVGGMSAMVENLSQDIPNDTRSQEKFIYSLINGNTVYKIETYLNTGLIYRRNMSTSGADKYRSAIDSILSTFKFIEQSQPISLEECISAASPLEYATKSGIGGDRFSLISEWWQEPKPVTLPFSPNIEALVYDLPNARMGGSDVSFTTFFKYGDQFCKFTDNNIKAIFSPITTEKALSYFRFRINLGGSIYSKNKEIITTIDAYDIAAKTYNKTIPTSDRLITTATSVSDGFIIDHIYSSLNVKIGFYHEKAFVGTDGKITWLERASDPFIYLAPGIMY